MPVPPGSVKAEALGSRNLEEANAKVTGSNALKTPEVRPQGQE